MQLYRTRLWVTHGSPWHRVEAKIGMYSSPTCWRKVQVHTQPHPVYIMTHSLETLDGDSLRCPCFRDYSRKQWHFGATEVHTLLALYPGHCMDSWVRANTYWYHQSPQEAHSNWGRICWRSLYWNNAIFLGTFDGQPQHCTWIRTQVHEYIHLLYLIVSTMAIYYLIVCNTLLSFTYLLKRVTYTHEYHVLWKEKNGPTTEVPPY